MTECDRNRQGGCSLAAPAPRASAGLFGTSKENGLGQQWTPAFAVPEINGDLGFTGK
jgi:hypothetical protein